MLDGQAQTKVARWGGNKTQNNQTRRKQPAIAAVLLAARQRSAPDIITQTTIHANAMPYKIERKRNGVVKRFTGVVTYDDVLKSEQEVAANPDFTTLRFVISDYIGATYSGISDDQQADINALHIGGYKVNPRIKYALIIQDPGVRVQIKDAVASGVLLHAAKIFDTYEQAAAWVGL